LGDDENIAPQSGLEITQAQFEDAVDKIIEDEEEEYDTDESGKIQPNVRQLMYGSKEKVKHDFSQIFLLSSMKLNGVGKTSLLYHMGKEVAKEKFSFERNFFFKGGLKDIKARTDDLPVGDILCADEMIRLWYKRRAMTKGVIDLNEWMAADQRKTQVIFAGAVPDFWDMDRYAVGGKVDYYIECLARGVGVIFHADRFPHTDPWHEQDLLKLQKYRRKHTSESYMDKIRILKKHPCYDGMVFWKRMPKEDLAIYKSMVDKISHENEELTIEDEITKFKREYMEKEGGEKFKSQRAVVNLVDMLKLRGAPMVKVLKEAGLDLNLFRKWEKEIKTKEQKVVDKIVSGEIETTFSNPLTPRTELPTKLEPLQPID
jgi:hypothetical protein